MRLRSRRVGCTAPEAAAARTPRPSDRPLHVKFSPPARRMAPGPVGLFEGRAAGYSAVAGVDLEGTDEEQERWGRPRCRSSGAGDGADSGPGLAGAAGLAALVREPDALLGRAGAELLRPLVGAGGAGGPPGHGDRLAGAGAGPWASCSTCRATSAWSPWPWAGSVAPAGSSSSRSGRPSSPGPPARPPRINRPQGQGRPDPAGQVAQPGRPGRRGGDHGRPDPAARRGGAGRQPAAPAWPRRSWSSRPRPGDGGAGRVRPGHPRASPGVGGHRLREHRAVCTVPDHLAADGDGRPPPGGGPPPGGRGAGDPAGGGDPALDGPGRRPGAGLDPGRAARGPTRRRGGRTARASGMRWG